MCLFKNEIHKQNNRSLVKHTISNDIVELHGTMVDVANLCEHSVDVQCLHKHPGKCTHEEIVQDYSHHLA